MAEAVCIVLAFMKGYVLHEPLCVLLDEDRLIVAAVRHFDAPIAGSPVSVLAAGVYFFIDFEINCSPCVSLELLREIH